MAIMRERGSKNSVGFGDAVFPVSGFGLCPGLQAGAFEAALSAMTGAN